MSPQERTKPTTPNGRISSNPPRQTRSRSKLPGSPQLLEGLDYYTPRSRKARRFRASDYDFVEILLRLSRDNGSASLTKSQSSMDDEESELIATKEHQKALGDIRPTTAPASPKERTQLSREWFDTNDLDTPNTPQKLRTKSFFGIDTAIPFSVQEFIPPQKSAILKELPVSSSQNKGENERHAAKGYESPQEQFALLEERSQLHEDSNMAIKRLHDDQLCESTSSKRRQLNPAQLHLVKPKVGLRTLPSSNPGHDMEQDCSSVQGEMPQHVREAYD